MSLLSLPRELRNMIYTHIALPTTPPSSVIGLCLSCHQIRAEYTCARSTNLHRWIRETGKIAQDIHISLLPNTHILSPKFSIKLELSTRIHTDYPYPANREPDTAVLQAVLDMYFDTVVIAFREDGDVAFSVDHVRWIHRCVVQGLLLRRRDVRARRVVIEIPCTRDDEVVGAMGVLMDAGLRRQGLGGRVVCLSGKREGE
jgi:hypothetical protein